VLGVLQPRYVKKALLGVFCFVYKIMLFLLVICYNIDIKEFLLNFNVE